MKGTCPRCGRVLIMADNINVREHYVPVDDKPPEFGTWHGRGTSGLRRCEGSRQPSKENGGQ